MSESLLRVTSLTKTYHVGPRPVSALRDVSLELDYGQSLSVTGYSGSGKSTLLGLIGGLERPTSGEIEFKGRRYSGLSEAELTVLRRKDIGFVFQTFNLIPGLSAFDNIFLCCRLAGQSRPQAGQRSRELLEVLGMGDRAGHLPSQLSGGEQQRVAVARSLASRPALLIADEPTGDLDSDNGRVVADLILGLCKENGSSCVIATHNLELAGRTDRNIALKDGCVQRGSGR